MVALLCVVGSKTRILFVLSLKQALSGERAEQHLAHICAPALRWIERRCFLLCADSMEASTIQWFPAARSGKLSPRSNHPHSLTITPSNNRGSRSLPGTDIYDRFARGTFTAQSYSRLPSFQIIPCTNAGDLARADLTIFLTQRTRCAR